MNYVLARLREASTWQGLSALAGLIYQRFDPAHTKEDVAITLSAIALIHAVFPQSGVVQKAPPGPQPEA